MKIRWFTFLIALFSATQAAGAEPIVRVVVKDANAHGMAVGLGELVDQNVVIASYSRNRLTIDQKYKGATEIYSSLAKRLGGTITHRNEVIVIHPSCLDVTTPETDISLSPERASFNFDFTRATALFQVFTIISNLPFQVHEPAAHSTILGVRLRDVSYRTAYNIVAAASRAELRRNGATYIAIDMPGNMQCTEILNAAPIPDTYQGGDCQPKITPYVAKLLQKVRCEPPEGYPLRDLIPRGFVDVAARRFVVLEAANHRTFFATKGHYVGHHLGKITSIDDYGFVVQELQQDSEGFYYHTRTRIDYSNNRTDLPME